MKRLSMLELKIAVEKLLKTRSVFITKTGDLILRLIHDGVPYSIDLELQYEHMSKRFVYGTYRITGVRIPFTFAEGMQSQKPHKHSKMLSRALTGTLVYCQLKKLRLDLNQRKTT